MAPHLRLLLPVLLPAMLFGVTGCTQDPIDRPGTWQASGVNDNNLRAMVAKPTDLERGVAASSERGNAGAAAATRLYTERRRPLPNVRATSVGAAPSEQPSAPLPGLTGFGMGTSR
jgi:hypothetical protein